jgi:hypothetical protein
MVVTVVIILACNLAVCRGWDTKKNTTTKKMAHSTCNQKLETRYYQNTEESHR